jgi:hypothetical protein
LSSANRAADLWVLGFLGAVPECWITCPPGTRNCRPGQLIYGCKRSDDRVNFHFKIFHPPARIYAFNFFVELCASIMV